MSWPEPVERVAVFLRSAGAESRLEEFTSAAASAQGAAEAIGCDLDQIVKSLVFVCGDRSVLALVPGDRRADPAKVGVAAGSTDVRVARPPEVIAATGVPPGAVGPFRRRRASRSSSSAPSSRSAVVWVGAGSDRHMAMVAPTELVRLTQRSTVDIVQE